MLLLHHAHLQDVLLLHHLHLAAWHGATLKPTQHSAADSVAIRVTALTCCHDFTLQAAWRTRLSIYFAYAAATVAASAGLTCRRLMCSNMQLQGSVRNTAGIAACWPQPRMSCSIPLALEQSGAGAQNSPHARFRVMNRCLCRWSDPHASKLAAMQGCDGVGRGSPWSDMLLLLHSNRSCVHT
jgi:hypothetical protein